MQRKLKEQVKYPEFVDFPSIYLRYFLYLKYIIHVLRMSCGRALWYAPSGWHVHQTAPHLLLQCCPFNPPCHTRCAPDSIPHATANASLLACLSHCTALSAMLLSLHLATLHSLHPHLGFIAPLPMCPQWHIFLTVPHSLQCHWWFIVPHMLCPHMGLSHHCQLAPTVNAFPYQCSPLARSSYCTTLTVIPPGLRLVMLLSMCPRSPATCLSEPL